MIISDVVQGSVAWANMRLGTVTGSRLGRLFGIRTAPETLLNELVSERMTEPDMDNFCGRKMEWGNTWEPVAVEKSSKHRGVQFVTCGMMICEEMKGFAISPDAVSFEGSKIVGGLETKCPDSKTHIEYLRGAEVPKKYKWQVYAPFICSKDVEWWDFASYDPRVYNRDLYMVRVNRKDIKKEIKEATEVLGKFLKQVDAAHQSLIF